MRGSEFVTDSIDLLYYHLQKVSLKRNGSYVDSPERLKNKKAVINPQNNDDNCLQYALTVALNHQNFENNHQRISKIKPFIDQYNWEEIGFPSHSKDQKKLEQNNKTIALNILFVPHNTKQSDLHTNQNNFKRENKVILLMITDDTKWYYLAVKCLSTLLFTSKNNIKS